MVGAYTSESTPPATVYQILEVVLRAVPRQSLRARPKWLVAPGPSVAVVDALAGATGTNIAAATVAAATSTVEVLLIIPMAHSLCPSTVTTVPMPVNLLPAARACQCVSSPLSQNQGVGRRRHDVPDPAIGYRARPTRRKEPQEDRRSVTGHRSPNGHQKR